MNEKKFSPQNQVVVLAITLLSLALLALLTCIDLLICLLPGSLTWLGSLVVLSGSLLLLLSAATASYSLPS